MVHTGMDGGASREGTAGILSRVFIRWPSALVDTGTRRSIELSDSLVPPPYDHLERTGPAFERAYRERRAGRDGLRRALYDTYRRRFWWAALVFLAYTALSTAGPLLIRWLISWFEDGTAIAQGLLIAAGLGAYQVAEGVAHKHQWSEAWKSAQSTTALLRTQVLRKYLRMDRSARAAYPSGEVITLATADTPRVGQTSFFHMGWAVPLGIAGSCTILCLLLGWAGLVGIAVLIGGVFLSNVVNNRVYRLVPKIRAANGTRIGLVAELLGAARGLRSHAWEGFAERVVTRERAVLNELLIRRQRRLATLYLVNAAAPILMITSTLVTYVALGNTLRAADVFAAITVLTNLRGQLPELVRYLDMRNEWRVAVGKVAAFLDAPEIDAREVGAPELGAPELGAPELGAPEAVGRAGGGRAEAGSVTLSGATFTWPGGSDAEPCLGPVDLTIGRGELVCVLGRVGSGKSALLGALAGTLRQVAGTLRVPGSVVHVPQRPWTMQASIAENIRCFSPEDPERYAAVLRATALDADLSVMPARDATIVGDRGANLSGGQRQRVALARAGYEDGDVYLVDDPTSAVDDAVATTMLDELFTGVLDGRTRVIATHRLDYARRADRVVVLDEGRVVAVGRYDEIVATAPQLLPVIAAQAAQTAPAVAPAPETPAAVASPAPAEEPVRTGRITNQTYRDYLGVLAPGLLLAVLIGLALLAEGVLSSGSLWLGRWTERPEENTLFYAGVYAAIGLTALVLDRNLFSFAFSRGVTAGMTLHDGMLRRVLRAPLTFFDRTPSGRILTRFSADMETVDLELPKFTMDLLKVVVGFVVPAVALVLLGPPTVIVTVLVLVVYLRWQRRTRSSTVEASRLSKQAREPVISTLTEVVEGATSIEGRPRRVAGYEHEFRERVRVAHHADYTVNSLSRYFNLRLDLLGAVVLFGVTGLLVVEGVGPGYAGAGITFAYALVGALAMSLLSLRMLDLGLAGFERVHAYTQLPVETTAGDPAPPGWPAAGEVRFENVVLRYAHDLPPALDGVSFAVPAGTKVGIVGRTGSGKSSLFAALLRFVECDRGRILVDGVDVATIRLTDLRSRVAVIPQDPVLLPGTLRENLDPFTEFSDGEILAALGTVGIDDRLLALPGGLEHVFTIGGARLSAGERQLLCLARAVLHNSKVVLIDEATANLDMETDARVQRTLRSELAGATVLCIAHRRDTLVDADRVVTLDAGRVATVTPVEPRKATV
ncbi:ATP-binding cassette domain-containing protein [Plantactinospora sp. WMMB334]|uniref:ATP-binding cassette domain-containing protein n=1 Tax=Plantactinospora sp. WMMB334 TaxID=3404119 RepID=UPI003B964637